MRRRLAWCLGLAGLAVVASGLVARGQSLLEPLPGAPPPPRSVPVPYAPPPPPTFRAVPGPGAATPVPVRPVKAGPPQPMSATQETVFAWDALQQEVTVKPGATNVQFSFSLTNTSPKDVTINTVRTSCGCTVPKLPPMPWKIAAGDHGTFLVDLDLRGKMGVVTKTVTVDSTAGYRYLTLRASIPATQPTAMNSSDRLRNLQIASVDRKAVFGSGCAECHVTPGAGLHGKALFGAVCGVCHEAEHRASMVPDLRKLNKPQDAAYWREWITKGKEGTLMPAWAKTEGGPLETAQIDSLVEYLGGPFKSESAPPRRTVTAGLAKP